MVLQEKIDEINSFSALLAEKIKEHDVQLSSTEIFEDFMLSIKPEREYDDYLRDKAVVVVGPSNYLLDFDNKSITSEIIDSYDVVVRIKIEKYLPSLTKKKHLVPFIGKKIDVVYSWREIVKHLKKDKKTLLKFKLAEVGYFRNPTPMSTGQHDVKVFIDPADDNYKGEKFVLHHVKYDVDGYKRYVDALNSNNLLKTENGRPKHHGGYRKIQLQTGTSAVMELLASNAKEIFITGMTFWHGGGHMFRTPPRAHTKPIVGKHDASLEMRLFIDFMIHEVRTKGHLERIKVDKTLHFIVDKYLDAYISNDEEWHGKEIANRITKEVRDVLKTPWKKKK
jgi:hypothetical protein